MPKVRGQPGHRVDLQTDCPHKLIPGKAVFTCKEVLPKVALLTYMRPLLHLDQRGRNAGGRILNYLGPGLPQC